MIHIFNDRVPKNPYTRIPISFKDRKRFRKILNLYTPKEKINMNPWIHIAHILEESGSVIISRMLLACNDDLEFMNSFMISLSHRFTDLIHSGLIQKIQRTFKHALWLRLLVAYETVDVREKFGVILFAILNEYPPLTARHYIRVIREAMLN